ncbi:EAL domain-containing protein [Halalkalibacillus halophilus]|uniref:EAL domain-containing protein n=1 Tax=Halalkalibacillus halophilus TaxID=392827 RepID=UPI0004255950|nr:EAL domain-containing protein [Halalkalibacillus halophilus]
MLKTIDELDIPVNEWLYQNASDAIIFVDAESQIISANQAASQLLNFNQTTSSIDANDYLDLKVLTKHSNTEVLVRTKHTPEKLVIMMGKQIEEYMCIVLREGGLKEKKDSLLYTLNHVRNGPYEGIIMHDKGNILDCDYAFSTMMGYTREELIGTSIFKLVHEDDHNYLYKNLNIDKHESPYPLRGFKKDGTVIYAEILPEPVHESEKNLRVAIVRNITERVENEKQIEFMAYFDELTDLPNRNYFQKVLEDELNKDPNKECNKKLAVHSIDLDYFKHINDTLGYEFGDQLLNSCAKRLKLLLVDDIFLARMDSDSFIILQRNVTSSEEAERFAEKLLELFRSPQNINGFEIYCSASVGISVYPDNSKDSLELIEHADSAMNVIKKESRNNYKMYHPDLKNGFKELLKLETELHKAIERKDFELHFQPQYDIHSHEIIGFEALCRWNHSELGQIPPDQFIPLAEKTGLILELGEWVLREACKLNKQWHEEGLPPVKVCVNLSVKQFLQGDLVNKVDEILKEQKLEPKFLELEITESIAMSNEKYIIETLNQFKKLGVNVALDDFGTGYSSLQYLSQFPLSKIKIDRHFIQNQTVQNNAIVKSIIHLSHALNLKVIAEGVEQELDLEFLLSEACDEVQGFYFSKPVPSNLVKDFFVS